MFGKMAEQHFFVLFVSLLHTARGQSGWFGLTFMATS